MSEFAHLYFVESVSGTVTSPSNAFGAPDGTWTTDDASVDWSHRWRLDSLEPTVGSLLTVGDQVLTLRLRKSRSSNCTVTSVVLIQGLAGGSTSTSTIRSSSFQVSSLDGQDLVITFPSLVLDGTTTDVVIEVNTKGASSGGPGDRGSVQIDGATWTASYEPVHITTNESSPFADIQGIALNQSHIIAANSIESAASTENVYVLMTQPLETVDVDLTYEEIVAAVTQNHSFSANDVLSETGITTLSAEIQQIVQPLNIESSSEFALHFYQYIEGLPILHENFTISTIADMTVEMFDMSHKYTTRHQPGSFISFFTP